MILSGSKAMRHWFPQFNREPKDTDYIVFENVENKIKGIEYLVNPVFKDYSHDVLEPNDLYTLKISHIFWNINWDKHMFDIQFLRKAKCVLKLELFHNLYNYWNDYHGTNKRSDLKMNATNFFDNALKKYDHDFLHTLINPNPTYKKILKDGEQVDVDKQKFILLSHEEKLSLVREEIYVMAYERLAGRDYRTAYAWMLKKFIISHAPLWEAFFIIDNYIELLKPIFNYKKHLDHELQKNH